jgi:hypothetical protein
MLLDRDEQMSCDDSPFTLDVLPFFAAPGLLYRGA